MGEFLGKINFNQGLTTNKRGMYGNTPVLNICHGYDTSQGELTPVNNVGEQLTTLGYDESNDYVIEFNDNFYSFKDFCNEVWKGTDTVEDIFGELTLLSRPCVSDRLIVYPTDKGLFSFEPEAETERVRYLSFASPDDYDAYDSATYKLQASWQTNTPTKLFNGNGTGVNCTASKVDFDDDHTNCILKVKVNDGIDRTTGFTYTETLSNSLSDTKGWFIYDICIKNDTQSYENTTAFENKDATISGYEIAFSDNNGDIFVCGITKLEPITDRWYRCISYIDIPSNKTATKIVLRNADYYNAENTDREIYIGLQSFESDTTHQWRYVGNAYFNNVEAQGSYKKQFENDETNTQDTSAPTNLIKHNDFENISSISESGFNETDTGLDFTSHFITVSPAKTVPWETGKTFSKAYQWRDFSSIEGIFNVDPQSYYNFNVLILDERANCILSVERMDKDKTVCFSHEFSQTQEWKTFQTGVNNNYEIFTGNATQIKIKFRNNSDRLHVHIIAPYLKKIANRTLYKTTRVLYDYDKDDVFDEFKYIHNTNEFSYSFCGRNKINTIDNAGLITDRYKVMISNASTETERIGDHPFANTILQLNTLPKKTINGSDYDIKYLYNQYFTDILLYKSLIYGNTGLQVDFSYIGRINKTWTSADSTRQRFKNNYMTTNGFHAVDDSPYLEDNDKNTYYDLNDKWHAVNEQQEIYNDFLEQAGCVTHANGRLFAGNIDNEAQPTGLAISNYEENWIFPTSVDEGSLTGTGTQTDNLHNISNRINALANCKDRVFIFYDKEIVYLYGNDFYSSNGFGTTTVCRLYSLPKTITNGIKDLLFSDGKDIYHLGVGGELTNISTGRVEVKDMDLSKASTMFYDNKYYILEASKIYVYESLHNGWYTIDRQNIKQLIDYILKPRVVTKDGTDYGVADLYGGDLSGERIVETMYQVVNGEGAEADVDITGFAIECECPSKNELLDVTMFSQGEFYEDWNIKLPINDTTFRYNHRGNKFNRTVDSVKQRLVYNGDNPPTIYSIGVIRNAKVRE